MLSKRCVLFLGLFVTTMALSSCFQAYDNGDDEDLRTVPVTNNPHIVPRHGSGIPGMPTQQPR